MKLGIWGSCALIGLSALAGCGGTTDTTRGEAPRVQTAEALDGHDGREIRLVGVYRRVGLDLKLGDPARDPGWVVLWVGGRPVRLGLVPRPLEEQDRLVDATVEVRGLFQLKPMMASPLPLSPELGLMPVLEPAGDVQPIPMPQ